MARTYFASYPGDLTPDDARAFERAGFALYENAEGGPQAWERDETPPPAASDAAQTVRLTAENEEEARREVVEALGREPEDLRVWTPE